MRQIHGISIEFRARHDFNPPRWYVYTLCGVVKTVRYDLTYIYSF